MAVPRVFVSSTWYDLRYIRESLKYFIKTLGYDPVLSEEGSVFYDPTLHVQDACLHEVPNCQIFVLLIGGRHGTGFKGLEASITNHEFKEARKRKIPVFALVEQSVLNDYTFYSANRDNSQFLQTLPKFPATDNTQIFDFIDEVQTGSVNNALVPFRNFDDIESYLRQQFAGMMFAFLADQNERDRVSDTLAVLTGISARVELMSQQILGSVGTPAAKLTVLMHERMLQSACIRDMAYMGAKPTPHDVIVHPSFRTCYKASALHPMEIDNSTKVSSVGPSGRISRPRFDKNSVDYKELRSDILRMLKDASLSAQDFFKETERNFPTGAARKDEVDDASESDDQAVERVQIG